MRAVPSSKYPLKCGIHICWPLRLNRPKVRGPRGLPGVSVATPVVNSASGPASGSAGCRLLQTSVMVLPFACRHVHTSCCLVSQIQVSWDWWVVAHILKQFCPKLQVYAYHCFRSSDVDFKATLSQGLTYLWLQNVFPAILGNDHLWFLLFISLEF